MIKIRQRDGEWEIEIEMECFYIKSRGDFEKVLKQLIEIKDKYRKDE